MTRLLLLVTALFSMWHVAAADNGTGSLTEHTLKYKGVEYTYHLYMPRDLPADAPLVIFFHGYGTTEVHKRNLGLNAEERVISKDELDSFMECGLCGTAAVISPVGKIVDHGREICFPAGMTEMGPVTKKLYETLTGIQMGRIEAPEGWIKVIK